MIIKIEYQTAGPYKSVEAMIDACDQVELPTSKFYQEQSKTVTKLAPGARLEISEHFGPVLWLYPPKDTQNFDPKLTITITLCGETLSFPKNNPDCYGIGDKNILEITITKNNKISSNKYIFTRLS